MGLVLELRIGSLRASVGQKSYQVGKSEVVNLRVAVELKCLQHLCTFSHLAVDFELLSLIPFLVLCILPLLLRLGLCMLDRQQFSVFRPRCTSLVTKEVLRTDTLFVCLGFFSSESCEIGDNVGAFLQPDQVGHDLILGKLPDVMFFTDIINCLLNSLCNMTKYKGDIFIFGRRIRSNACRRSSACRGSNVCQGISLRSNRCRSTK